MCFSYLFHNILLNIFAILNGLFLALVMIESLLVKLYTNPIFIPQKVSNDHINLVFI